MIEDLRYIFNAPIATIIVCAGIFFIFIFLIGEITGWIKVRGLSRIVFGTIGVILLLMGLFLSGYLSNPIPPTITVEITSPQDDAIISSNNTTVSGIASNVPEDKYLWVIVKKAGDNKFYPCDGWRPIHEDEWNVKIWLPKPNKKCTIFAYLADKQANEELKNHVNTRIGHPGMLSLPDVVESYDRINVTWNPS